MMFKNKLIFNKYKVKRFMELSDFCWVYQGVNIKNNEPVFLKFEKRNSQFNFLESEAYCLYNLKGFGLPKILSYGKTGLYNVLIEELLGNSLYNLWKLVALQIINRLEYIHSKNYIHRDIKPQNFVNGREDPHIIYIIDFGFSRKYRSSRTGKHIKYINKKLAIGSLSFISINANIGYEQSRRDDLESLGYMLIFFANDNLPWMKFEDLNINKAKKCLKIYNSKKTISVEKLCKGLPEEFIQYINYTRKLEFEEDPNYDYLRKLFLTILFKNQEKNDLKFFWIINKKKFKKEDLKSESVSITFKRRGGSKNRLFNQIKSLLEKKESQKKESKENSLQLEHVNNSNFKYGYKSINNKENKEDKNGETNNKIFNAISNYKNKYTCNFNDFSINNNKNLIDKNNIIKSNIINNNKNSKEEIQAYNMYDKNTLNDKSNYKNAISPLGKNYNFYCSKKNLLYNNSYLKNEGNNLINSKVYNKEYIFNDSNNQNKILEKKSIYQNTFAKRKNNYKTINVREKEKEKIKYKHYSKTEKPILNSFNSINKKNNKNINRKINLVGKDTLKNNGQKNIIENNNIYNNNLINNSFFIFKNMEIPSLKQNKFKNYNGFKEILNNKSKFVFKKIDSYQAIPNKMKNHLNLEHSDSQISFKTDNNLFGRRDRELFEVKIKTNKKFNKDKIIYNLSSKNVNDLFSSINSIPYSNMYSLNNNIINNDNIICLTQTDEPIKFQKEYINNKNIAKHSKIQINLKNI